MSSDRAATPMNPASKNDPPHNSPWSGDRHLGLLVREVENVEALTSLATLAGDQETARRTYALAERFHQIVLDRTVASTMSGELRQKITLRLEQARTDLDKLAASFGD